MFFMKRKLIRQGKNALTVTLPAKWIEENRLNAGDEVDISEGSAKIIISSNAISHDLQKLKIDAKHYLNFINIATCSLYRSGADEIRIKYDDSKLLEKIQSQIEKQLIGFEIVEQDKGSCLVKSLTDIGKDSFEDMMKRLFSLIITVSESVLKGIRDSDEEILKNTYFIDRTINKTSNFIARMLVKTDIGDERNSHFYYALIRQLEELGDYYRDLGLYCSSSAGKSITPNEIKEFELLNAIVEDIRLCYFNFSDEKSDTIMSKLKDKRNMIKQSLEKSKNPVFCTYMLMISETLKGIVIKIMDIKLGTLLNSQ